MLTRLCKAFAAAALLTIGGCGTPSIHPVWSKDKDIAEPTLVGVWRAGEEKTTYTVARDGDAYRMTARDNDQKNPEEWALEMRLVKLGDARFADLTTPDSERSKVGDHWGAFFIPTHMFVKYAVEGDNLRVWVLGREWLERSAAGNKAPLPFTPLGMDLLLITAETPALQAFLQAHASDAAAFGEPIELKRVKP
jgi:hypothetical protein